MKINFAQLIYNYKSINKWQNIGLPSLVFFFFILSWELISRLFNMPDYLLPSPLVISKELISSRGLLLHHAQITLIEILVGFFVAFIISFLLAVVISHSKFLNKILMPPLIASQTVPIIVIAPLLVIWFGYGILPKIITIVIICFFPIVVNTTKGLNEADGDIIKLMQSFGANKMQIFSKIKLPNALPTLFAGIKIGITLSVIGAVIAEWMGADEGLGYLIQVANAQLNTKLIFADIVILILVGITLYASVAIVEKAMVPWANKID